jgi:glycosyltransferase involved in cell wall biosynthesis
MSNDGPLLSICIPTYNRASYLEATLRSITERSAFQQTNEVEIIVSDNCSTDLTPQVISGFREQFPEKIRCLRAAAPVVPSVNFALALEAGRGRLRKLHNDTLRANDGFLEECARLVRKYEVNRPFLFFLNGNNLLADARPQCLCASLDAFVGRVSFYATWIGAFSLWKEDVPKYAPVFRKTEHQFAQTEILFAAAADGREVLVHAPKFGEPSAVIKSWTSKSLNEVYVAQYLPLLRKYVISGHIASETEKREIRRFCLAFYIPFYSELAGVRLTDSLYRDFSFIRKYTHPSLYIFMHIYYVAYRLCYRLRKTRYAGTFRKIKTMFHR